MSSKNTITRFEHQKIKWSEISNQNQAKKALEWFEKKQNFKPFRYTADGVKAKQYVGVISLGGQMVQVLPKVFSDDKFVKTNITGLMYLLQLTKKLKFKEVDLARLCKHTDSMLEVFIKLFSDNLFDLLQNDFRRNYVPQEDNLKFVKGKINF